MQREGVGHEGARAASVDLHPGQFLALAQPAQLGVEPLRVMGPPAASRMPASSFRISEQSRRPPPRPPSKRIHAAREPLPSMPESQARTGRSRSRLTTGRAGAAAAVRGGRRPDCSSR